MTKAHYNEPLRIVKGFTVTTTVRGYAACSPGRLVDYSTHVRSEVTCKRCLHLIAAHDASVENAKVGPFVRWSRGLLLALKCRACGVKMTGPCIEPVCKPCGGVDHIILRVARSAAS